MQSVGGRVSWSTNKPHDTTERKKEEKKRNASKGMNERTRSSVTEVVMHGTYSRPRRAAAACGWEAAGSLRWRNILVAKTGAKAGLITVGNNVVASMNVTFVWGAAV